MAFWMAGRSRNSPPVRSDEQRLDFAAQFGVGLRQQRRALLGGRLASRMIELFDLPQTLRAHGVEI